MALEKSYRPREVAARWCVGLDLIYRRIRQRDIRAFRLGRRVLRIPHAEVLRVEREGFGFRDRG